MQIDVLVWSIGLVAACILGAEIFARYGLGLGNPPLVMIDSKMEYVFRPGSYRRFNNYISYNSWSMRASEVPPEKSCDDFRVLVLGDSVVNGGALTDQNDLASE